ncbi:MAG: hypothetical protein H0W34_05280 [Pyrinomonadaceae bacterium]|nr:hypothetical protein [Pyrinomonadaceae bacterium]
MKHPFGHLFWQQRELQKMLDQLRPQLDTLQVIPPFLEDHLSQLATLRDHFALPASYLDAFTTTQEMLAANPNLDALKNLTRLNLPTVEMLAENQSRLQDLLEKFSASPAIDLSTNRLLESLVAPETLLDLGHLNVSLADAMLQNTRAFQAFAEGRLSSAITAADVIKRNQLGLIDSAADLASLVNTGFELGALAYPALASTLLEPWTPTNVYGELDSELESLDLTDAELEVEDAVQETNAATIATLGAGLVQVVYNLNVEAEREGKEATFKPTNKGFLACALIPSRVAVDEESFNGIVDNLYFLLYEGSGAAARLTASYPPERLDGLWRLKHLRLAARHDVDHGSPAEIRTKNQQIEEAYAALTGAVHPRTRSDWAKAQVALYQQLLNMLEDLWYGDDE